MKKFAGFTREQVENQLRWVVKYMGWRDMGTMPELEARGFHWDDEEIREVGLAASQTPEMQAFVDAWFELERKHGFTPLPALFEKYGQPA